ncbi:MAG: hypothetical protein AVDCRST_MAG93-4164 [uncultured Chloroflexia bacterium]|uniref:Sulfotransferase domain-containing protein n=1 Tax=uncultured Chloroflexia bacterium TaxID=1672391 RepID=A0A6J4K3C5_9CHLR|nr:MAG: hypothetical protein AVDCRST_MAG93-4164 [uncultured Chloroflexia bacterium]
MYPDFLIIGAQKAGTTWLHHNLRIHPQIWMPDSEVHYFDRKIKDARSYNDEWYASLFEPEGEQAVGECTPSYSVIGRDMVAHVHELMPQAKLIFSMRNPIERVWSQTNMMLVKRDGGVERVTEEDLRERFAREKLQLRTDYLRTLENWGAYYPPERIFISFLEDIHFHPAGLLAGVCDFLGVDYYRPGEANKSFLRPRKMKKRINSRSTDKMPTWVASYLAHAYENSSRQLEQRFGGYTSFWRYCTERLIEAPPSGESVTYPLWDSSLREAWSEDSEGNSEIFQAEYLQSGPLSSIQTPEVTGGS